MSFRPATDHQTLSLKVAHQLQESIGSGRYRPGDKLPTQQQLSRTFQVSRAAVRDALKILCGTGLIIMRQGVGAVVAGNADRQLAQQLTKGMQIRTETIRNLFEIRKVVEAEGAAWAALRCSPDEVEQLTQQVQATTVQVESEPFDPARHQAANRQFHDLLAAVSQNRLLPELLITLREKLDQWRVPKPATRERARESLREHRRILSAIASGDAERARWAMRQHLGDVEELDMGRLDRVEGR